MPASKRDFDFMSVINRINPEYAALQHMAGDAHNIELTVTCPDHFGCAFRNKRFLEQLVAEEVDVGADLEIRMAFHGIRNPKGAGFENGRLKDAVLHPRYVLESMYYLEVFKGSLGGYHFAYEGEGPLGSAWWDSNGDVWLAFDFDDCTLSARVLPS